MQSPGKFTQLPVSTDNSRQGGRESPHSGNRGYHVVSQRASRFSGGDRRRDAGREPSAWNLPHSLAGSPGDGRILRPGHRYPASAPTGDGCPRLAGPASCGTCRTDIGPVPSGLFPAPFPSREIRFRERHSSVETGTILPCPLKSVRGARMLFRPICDGGEDLMGKPCGLQTPRKQRPLTRNLLIRWSPQLRDMDKERWRAWEDSNPRPAA